jgi:hypothetical protein
MVRTFADCIDLLLCEIIESPIRLIDGDSERPTMLSMLRIEKTR